MRNEWSEAYRAEVLFLGWMARPLVSICGEQCRAVSAIQLRILHRQMDLGEYSVVLESSQPLWQRLCKARGPASSQALQSCLFYLEATCVGETDLHAKEAVVQLCQDCREHHILAFGQDDQRTFNALKVEALLLSKLGRTQEAAEIECRLLEALVNKIRDSVLFLFKVLILETFSF